jgi:NhaP-type Na+/H+ or K+/H+ antiporter
MVSTVTAAEQQDAFGLAVVGLFLLAGFAAHVLGRGVHVPRVTLLLILGFLAGPYAFHLVPREASDWFPTVARIALSLVGFQLGERFFGKKLRETARSPHLGATCR